MVFIGSILSISARAANWESAPSLNTARVGASSVAYNGYIYVFGGRTNGNVVLNTVERFDPASGVWDNSTVPNFTYPRYNAAAAVYQGKIYLIAGHYNNDVTDKVEVYDPVQNSWQEVNELRREREGLSAVVFNDTLFVLGGQEYAGYYEEEIEWYDVQNDDWEKREDDIVEPRAAAFISVFQDKLYMCGGTYFGLMANSYIANSAFTWFSGPQMQTGRSYGGTAKVNDLIYMIGGETGSGVSSLVEVYNPFTLSIDQGPNLPAARSGLTSAVLNDTIYAIGGWSTNHTQILPVVHFLKVDPSTAISDENNPRLPNRLQLAGYPNPFNGIIQFKLNLPQSGEYNLSVYDIQGKRVREIQNGYLSAGTYNAQWNGSGRNGTPAASGIYLAVLKSANYTKKLKIVYVK